MMCTKSRWERAKSNSYWVKYHRPRDYHIIKEAKYAVSVYDLAKRLGYASKPGSNTYKRFERVLGYDVFHRLAPSW